MAESEPERVRSPPPPPDPHIFSSGTYVIQIPKDQIYRVPPPENALIVKRHLNPSITSSNQRRSCLRLFLPISIVFVLVILLVILLHPLLTPLKPPVVKLTNFNLSPSSHDFRVELDIRNPNSAGSISFQSPSRASLSFRENELAVGKFPLIRQDHGSKRHVALALQGISSFPKEFQRRMKNDESKLRVAMSLKMNVGAQTTGRLGMSQNVKFVVVCSFTINTLGKNAKILSQDCES